ncbi:hypothetical protein [Segniliparus rugosus]|uniref:Uncharacterized protein n=1 Tax=Segniliparus rugosus (strain ATCC BAA-974 / DSM 45345 / CCUG 50838 / CIP 108380 / JCM 13579 / CDC 945) TaxID=679197 RepID=E5XR61_SEGRC|nr:hypothetical protein [Segniliparus rugosus]EFV13154.1 hypothetical protein HMPREF9336_01983 [Segniliparus rugosus ATCC BAA-974]
MGIRVRAVSAVLVAATSSGLLAPTALAEPTPPPSAPQPAKVSCSTLDQVQESLDDDIDAGVGGLRIVISSPYASGSSQKNNADDKINMVAHGVTYLKGVDDDSPVPGLARILDKMDRGVDDMRNAVDSLFHWSPGTWNGLEYLQPSMGLAFPQQGTWDTLDYVDEQQEAASDLVAQLRGSCS